MNRIVKVLPATAVVLVLGFTLALPLGAQAPAPPQSTHPRKPKAHVTKGQGEEEAVKKREEWFYGPRQAGAVGRMAEMRAKAVEYTRLQEEIQKVEKEKAGVEAPESTTAWTCRGPSSSNFGGWTFGKVSGRIPALAKDWTNNILYVGAASGGVWKSTNDGTSWTPIFESAGTQTIGAITIDPNNSQTLWVGTGENTQWWCEEYFGLGIFRSTDGGSTWSARNGSGGSALDLSYFCSVTVNPGNSNNLVVAGFTTNCVNGSYSSGGIYSTTDAGATWAKKLSGYVTSLVRDPNNAAVLWAGVYYGGVYKSTDSGLTWIQQTASSLPSGSNVYRIEVTVAPSNSNYVYALFEYNAATGVPELWRTTNGGTSWAKMCSGTNACDGQCGYNMTLRVDRANTDILYRGTIQLFKSTTGGSTWTNLTGPWGSSQKVHQDTHFLLMNPSSSTEFYVGCDGGLWKTTDGGSNFTNLNANLNLTQFYDVGIHPTNDDIITGGCQDNSSLARTTSDTWDVQDVTGDGFVTCINPSNTNYVYIASYPWDDGTGDVYPGMLRSTGGVLGSFSAWITGPGSGVNPTSRINWVTPYTLAPTSPSTLFVGTYCLYRSLNNGDTWTNVHTTDMTSGSSNTVTTVNVCRTNANYVYVGTSDGLIWRHTTGGGGTFTKIATGLPTGTSARQISDIEPDPTNGNLAFCALSGFGTAHLYEFNGSSWVARGTGLPNVPADTVSAVSDKEIYVGTDTGVFRSTDRGQNFAPFNTGLPAGTVVTDLEYNTTTHTLTAGTYGRGAWQYTLTVPDEAGVSPSLLWTAGATNRLTWGAAARATGYRVYRGAQSEVSKLPAGASVCLAYEGASTDTGAILTATPPSGQFFWYLAVGYNGVGNGSAGTGTGSSARVLNSTGTCASP